MARRGVPVFRIVRGTKNHFIDKAWTATATASVFDIADDWHGREFNTGLLMDGLVGIDVDVKGGKPGLASFAKIEPRLPRTYKQSTPSGGFHLIYRLPAGIESANSVENFAPGIDIRGFNGYILGPGSEVGGRLYEVIDHAPIADAPGWLIERLEVARRRDPAAPKFVGEIDTPLAIDSVVMFLKTSAELAVEGAGGNLTTYKVANACMDRGVWPETTADLMSEHWNERCSPAWDDHDLRAIVEHAASYRQNPIGCANPALGFCIVDVPRREAITRPVLFGSSARRWIGKRPAPIPFVIDQLVPEGLVTLLVSAGGRGKSTLAQQMLSCVASGRPFLGFKVKRGASAGIFCEDADNTLHNRQLAICRTLKIELEEIAENISPESYLGSDAVLWTERGGQTPLLAEIETQLRSRPDAKLLVVDGVSYVFAANEIDRGQVTRFIAALTAVAQRLRIAIVLIHHESKTTADTDTNAASGSTAWINACRSVVKLNDDGGDLRTLKHIKTNLAKRVPPLPCTLASGAFALIHDNAERREEVRSLTRTLLSEALSQGVKLSDRKQAHLKWAPRYLSKHPRGQGVTESEFEAALIAVADEFIFRDEIVRSKLTRRCVRVADGSPTVPDSDGSDG